MAEDKDSVAAIDDEYEWKPPTEAEMKLMEARRERSNKISKLMGDYLLKGYKMLGTSCSKCDTILLRDKQNVDYCIACSELESDVGKDDPALNSEAARRQAEEHRERVASTASQAQVATDAIGVGTDSPTPSFASVNSSTQIDMSVDVRPKTVDKATIKSEHSSFPEPYVMHTGSLGHPLSNGRPEVEIPISVVELKMKWATHQLEQSENVEHSVTLCSLIKHCADTLVALHAAKSVCKG